MAKKKVAKKEDEEKMVDVEVTETVETVEEPEIVEDKVEEVVETVEEPKAEVEESVEVEKAEENTVEIKEDAVQDNRPVKKDVKIKMARNHKCHIGGEFYDLKEGQVYVVPEFVKYTLAKAGVLAPL